MSLTLKGAELVGTNSDFNVAGIGSYISQLLEPIPIQPEVEVLRRTANEIREAEFREGAIAFVLTPQDEIEEPGSSVVVLPGSMARRSRTTGEVGLLIESIPEEGKTRREAIESSNNFSVSSVKIGEGQELILPNTHVIFTATNTVHGAYDVKVDTVGRKPFSIYANLGYAVNNFYAWAGQVIRRSR